MTGHAMVETTVVEAVDAVVEATVVEVVDAEATAATGIADVAGPAEAVRQPHPATAGTIVLAGYRSVSRGRCLYLRPVIEVGTTAALAYQGVRRCSTSWI